MRVEIALHVAVRCVAAVRFELRLDQVGYGIRERQDINIFFSSVLFMLIFILLSYVLTSEKRRRRKTRQDKRS